MQTRDRRQLTAFVVPKTTGQRGSFGLGVFSCTRVLVVRFRQNTMLNSGALIRRPVIQRNQEDGAPTLRPSSCSSSNCFCRSALCFSNSCNWAFPVLDVGDVVFHSRGDVKAAVPQLLDLVFFRLNSLFCGGDPVEQAAGLAVPAFFVLAGHGYNARFRLSICLSRFCFGCVWSEDCFEDCEAEDASDCGWQKAIAGKHTKPRKIQRASLIRR